MEDQNKDLMKTQYFSQRAKIRQIKKSHSFMTFHGLNMFLKA